MKVARVLFTCLAALAAGLFIGRQSAPPPATVAPVASTAPAGQGGNAPPPSGANDLLSRWKKTPGDRGKARLMLAALATNRPGDLRQLIEAAAGDPTQLSLLADLALNTQPAVFLTTLGGKFFSQNKHASIFENFVKRWARKDFDTAFRTAVSLPFAVGGWTGGMALETRMETDPTGALRIAQAHPGVRFNSFNDLNIPGTPENLELVRALSPSLGKHAMIKAISKNLTMDQAMSLTSGGRESIPVYGASKVAEVFMEKDPQAARDWMDAHPDHQAFPVMARRYGEELLKTDPAAAATWATAHLSGSPRNRILEKAAKALEKADPAAAQAARDLLPEAFKTNAKP